MIDSKIEPWVIPNLKFSSPTMRHIQPAYIHPSLALGTITDTNLKTYKRWVKYVYS